MPWGTFIQIIIGVLVVYAVTSAIIVQIQKGRSK